MLILRRCVAMPGVRVPEFDMPWTASCGRNNCKGCPRLVNKNGVYSCSIGNDVSELNI